MYLPTDCTTIEFPSYTFKTANCMCLFSDHNTLVKMGAFWSCFFFFKQNPNRSLFFPTLFPFSSCHVSRIRSLCVRNQYTNTTDSYVFFLLFISCPYTHTWFYINQPLKLKKNTITTINASLFCLLNNLLNIYHHKNSVSSDNLNRN